jgi:hypothetical protein
MKSPSTMTAASALMVAAGAAFAQPVVDGTRDASYGAPLWVQNLPTQFGDNQPSGGPCNPVGGGITIAINNSNIGGVNGAAADGAADVTTGVEIRIPLATLGISAMKGATIKIAGFINGGGHDFLSNQVVGASTTVPFGNLAEPRNVNFDDATGGLAGDQFVTVTDPACTASGGPVMDGTADAYYGDPLFVQTNPTGFGDSTLGTPDFANGSELDNVRARICTIDLDGDGPGLPQRFLSLFIAGNLESNFNKLDLFFDVREGGQQQLRGDNPDVDFNGLNRMGDNGSGNGLRFDTGFAADYYLTMGGGGSDCSGGTYSLFANFAEINTNGGGSGSYLGCGGSGTSTLNSSPACPPTVPNPDIANGSEIDAVYGRVVGDRLYLMVTGNLQSNFNKLNLFIDAAPGGQNTLRDNNQNIDFNGLNRMGAGAIPDFNDPDCATDPFNNPDCSLILAPGVTFDKGFAADYWMALATGGGQAGIEMFGNAAHLRTDGARVGFLGEPLDFASYNGGLKSEHNPVDFDGTTCVRTDPKDGSCIAFIDVQGDPFGDPPMPIIDVLYASVAPRLISEDPYNPLPLAMTGLIEMTVDNNNVAGVTGDSADAGAAAAVATGMEISIDLAELGWDGTSPIKVAGWIANSGHDVVSNQIIATDGLPEGTGNLNEPRTLDFNTFPGLQYVVVPLGGEPECPCDFNADEILNSQDFFDFLTAFFANQPSADYNNDDVINSQDFFDFLTCFFTPPAGCS